MVVNLWKDPSVTTIAGFNCGGGGTFSILNIGGYSGSQFMRGTVGATCGSATAGPFFAGINIAPGKTYTASAYVRTSRSLSFRAIIEWKLSDGGPLTGTSVAGNYVTTNDSSWVRVSSTGTAPANAGLATITVYGSMSAGDSVDVDAIMFTEGSTVYAYTDPTINSSWVWTGTANNSTSSGPTP